MKIKKPLQTGQSEGNQSFSKIKEGKVGKNKKLSIEHLENIKQDLSSVNSKKKNKLQQKSFTNTLQPIRFVKAENPSSEKNKKKKKKKRKDKKFMQNVSGSESPQDQKKQQNQNMNKSNSVTPAKNITKQESVRTSADGKQQQSPANKTNLSVQNKPGKPESDEDEDSEEESEVEEDESEEDESEEDTVKLTTKTFTPAVKTKSNNVTKNEEEGEDEEEEEGEDEEEEDEDDDKDSDDNNDGEEEEDEEEDGSESDDESDENEEGPVEEEIAKSPVFADSDKSGKKQDGEAKGKKNKQKGDVDTPPAKKFKESHSPGNESFSNDKSSGPPYKVFLGNLPETVTDVMIRDAFSFVGNIVTVEIQVRWANLKPSGVVFMELEDEETMQKVIDLNNIVKIGDQATSIRKAYKVGETGFQGGRGGRFSGSHDKGGRGGGGFGGSPYRGGRGGGGFRGSPSRGGGGFRGFRAGGRGEFRGGRGSSPFRGGRGDRGGRRREDGGSGKRGSDKFENRQQILDA